MSEVVETGSFAVPAAKLWELASDFGGVIKVMGIEGCVVKGEGVGATRTIPMGDDHVVELLDALDHEKYSLTYSIVSGPLPFKDYSSTMVVSADGDNACTLVWTGSFEPVGISAEKAETMVRGIYGGGIAGLRKALGL